MPAEERDRTAETGSVADIHARLLLWARRAPKGFARVEYTDERARRRVVEELSRSLAAERIDFREIAVRTGESIQHLSNWLIGELSSIPAGVVSITGFAEAIPPDRDGMTAFLYALNIKRESLAQPPLKQIWWMPLSLAEKFVHDAPDLDSWFLVRLRLTARMAPMDEPAFRDLPEAIPPRMDPEEARRSAADLLERFGRSLARGMQARKLIDLLIQPAVRRLTEAGLETEAIEFLRRAGAEIERSARSQQVTGTDSFFISYARADERWAEWIAWELERAGYGTRVMAWDFAPGANFVLEMQKAMLVAERTLVVLSPAYLKSAYASNEWTAAFAADPTGSERRLVPVRVTECRPEGLLAQIVAIDLAGLGQAEARARLLDGIRTGRRKPTSEPAFPGAARAEQPRAPSGPAFPGDLPRIWTLPYPPNPYFAGRGDLLEELHNQLTRGRRVAVTQPLAVHGLGGVGKTQLAVEYAYRFRTEYDAVLWVVADSPDAVLANLAALAKSGALDLPEADAGELQVQAKAVLRWLQGNGRWLVVFDSADSPEAVEVVRSLLPPRLTGHVLITSRLRDWPPTIAEMAVDVLPDKAAADFLLARKGKLRPSAGSRSDALAVARELGNLPLALEQAAAHIVRHRITFRDYLQRLRASRPALLKERVEGATRYQRSVARTWLATEERLGPVARAVLRLAGFLAPDDIPRPLFLQGGGIMREAAQALGGPGAPHLGDDDLAGAVDEALVELADHALINLMSLAFTCHRLVQAVQVDRLDAAVRRRWIDLALRLVAAYAPENPDDVRSWPSWELLWPHVEALLALNKEEESPGPTAKLMNELGAHLHSRALYSRAEQLFRRALALDEKALGPDHLSVAVRLNNLARLLQDTNRLAEAEPFFRRALAIDEMALGPDHPSVAVRLNNLAGLLQETNRLAEAEPLASRALAITEKALGPDHPSVGISLNNLASLLQASNRLAEAEPLFRRVLAIMERAFGSDHPNVATSLNNLAGLLQETNRLAEAEPLLRRALAITEKALGPDHASVGISLNNLASLLKATNRLAEAESLLRRALAVHEKALGPDHPNVGIALNNLALLLLDTNRLAEAEPHFRRALAIVRGISRIRPPRGCHRPQQSGRPSPRNQPLRRGRASAETKPGNPGQVRTRNRP